MILVRWLKRPRTTARSATLVGPVSRGRARQSLLDLAKRGDRGIFVHLPLWILIAVWSDLLAQQQLIDVLRGAVETRRALCIASVNLAFAAGVPLEGGAR